MPRQISITSRLILSSTLRSNPRSFVPAQPPLVSKHNITNLVQTTRCNCYPVRVFLLFGTRAALSPASLSHGHSGLGPPPRLFSAAGQFVRQSCNRLIMYMRGTADTSPPLRNNSA
ncbi:hypothetical protein J6590_104481 [Homalodisca vitripennis]|nr:hypothetical protein J6590_010266 [Homalodisca vitripennis]KAG8313906.1 hypothetical protein J6590_104481 [Homalodisca vitripennis]